MNAEKTRDYCVKWLQDYSLFSRYFFTEGQARAWITRELLSKTPVISIDDIQLIKVR